MEAGESHDVCEGICTHSRLCVSTFERQRYKRDSRHGSRYGSWSGIFTKHFNLDLACLSCIRIDRNIGRPNLGRS